MKTKNELLTDVQAIPEFVFRQVALADPAGAPAPGGVADQNLAAVKRFEEVSYDEVRAITEKENTRPLAFVSDRYKLLQFRDAFEPLINEHEDCTGNLRYDAGFAILDVFPKSPEYVLPNGLNIGLSAYNSVNKTSALIIRFSVNDGSRVIAFPKDVSRFYRAHVGNVEEKAKDYVEMLNKIKSAWGAITTQLSAIPVTPDLYDSMVKDLETDPRILKQLKAEVDAGAGYNMWTLAMRIYDEMDKRFAKTEIHRRKRLDAFIGSITNWSILVQF